MKTPPIKSETSIPRMMSDDRKRKPAESLLDEGKAIKKEKGDYYEKQNTFSKPSDYELEMKVKARETVKRVSQLLAKKSIVVTGPPKYLTDEQFKEAKKRFL